MLVWLPFPAGAQTPIPVGEEFQVNTYTTNYQGRPWVAADADGDFVVVWQSQGSSVTDTSNLSVQGQRYASDGTALGPEFQVNTYTTNAQTIPRVASEADGDFLVVWGSNGSSGTDSSGESIQGRRYASDGTPVGSQFQVNTYTTNNQSFASVAIGPNGGFVVVWLSGGSFGTDSSGSSVQGQRFTFDGVPVGSQFQVNSYTTGNVTDPDVAITGDGDFVVVWSSIGSYGSDQVDRSVQGQRYASDGTAVSSQFQVNTVTANYQWLPSVAAEADGDFAVVWDSGFPSNANVRARRYASDGAALGADFQVNTYTPNNQRFASVEFEPDGDFVVIWHSNGSSGTDTSSDSVQGKRYASNGTVVGSEFQVNTYTTGSQSRPSFAVQGDGDFVVAWNGSDASYGSVQSQRLAADFACDDERDNDGDGLVDLAQDPGCSGVFDESEQDPSLACDDGLDNDGDGVADTAEDPGCAGPTDESEQDPSVACDDGLDDDGDGFVDFVQDIGCSSPADGSEQDPALPCDDGLDNDGDDFVDFPQDFGCSSPSDLQERSAVCEDHLDNDGDGAVDLADPGCFNAGGSLENPQCQDGLDNDGDGGVDFDGGAAAGNPTFAGDFQCLAMPWKNKESGGTCGLGFEVAPLLLLVLGVRRARGRASTPRR